MLLETFGSEERIYNFERIGCFGQFACGMTFPIEYVQTTFLAEELRFLTFAREISPETLHFDLLMQRNINEERVRLKMAPYLNPASNSIAGDVPSKIVYFPPLQAAIVPIKGKTMETYYTNENSERVYTNIQGQKQLKHIIREWHSLFKITYLPSNHQSAYQVPIETADGIIHVGVQTEPVQVELHLAHHKERGIKLIIIDGQHRLFALLQEYERNPQLLEDIRVPVCILFAPFATVKRNQKAAPGRVPTVPEVFRRLFVDINSTAESVSGHFNILLADNTISSLTCRHFCDTILKKRGSKALALVEWNSQTQKKISTQISRPYFLTSVGMLDKALTDSVGQRKSLLNYLLQLEKVAEDLYPVSEDNDTSTDSPPPIQWHQFALYQKNIIEAQINKYLVPCLEKLFFGSQTFAPIHHIFASHLEQLTQLAQSDLPDALDAKPVVSQILESIPIPPGKRLDKARLIYRDFELAVAKDIKQQGLMLLQYLIFQRALLVTWAQFLEIARNQVPQPIHATKGFITLLDFAFRNNGRFFKREQAYMQYTVFSGSQLLIREDARKYLTNLLLAHLANPFYTQQVTDKMLPFATNIKKLATELQKLGDKRLAELPPTYWSARKRHFKVNYRFNESLPDAMQKQLRQAEEEQKCHRQEVKEGTRKKSAISTTFDELVDGLLQKDVQSAMKTLQHNLKIAKGGEPA